MARDYVITIIRPSELNEIGHVGPRMALLVGTGPACGTTVGLGPQSTPTPIVKGSGSTCSPPPASIWGRRAAIGTDLHGGPFKRLRGSHPGDEFRCVLPRRNLLDCAHWLAPVSQGYKSWPEQKRFTLCRQRTNQVVLADSMRWLWLSDAFLCESLELSVLFRFTIARRGSV